MINRKGFTLIEMLVVIAIVGLLSSVVVVGLTGGREKSRDARRIADLRSIQNQLELLYDSGTGYPASANANNKALPANVSPQKDPQGNSYLYETSGLTYTLGATLEDLKNAPGGVSPASCGGLTGANYCVVPD